MYSIYAYIDPPNHPNVGKYGSLMECLGVMGVPTFVQIRSEASGPQRLPLVRYAQKRRRCLACNDLGGRSRRAQLTLGGRRTRKHWCKRGVVTIPRHSMYAIFTYIGVVWGVNVGIYAIHGVSGIGSEMIDGAP